jgi:hypothetical protein
VNARIDHLVVVADTLEQGSQWCEATLGARPVAGGRHPRMGTHNHLLSIASERFPDSYLEIVAIDPDALPPAAHRWMMMDEPAVRTAVRDTPRLMHAVARTQMIEMLRWGLVNCGLNPGAPIAAERQTADGLLRWRITVRDDGQLECDGALPTLIEWQGTHPCTRLPASPVALREVVLRGVPPRALDVLKLPAVQALPRASGATADEPPLSAIFETPHGRVTLHSWHWGASAPNPPRTR